MAGDASFRRYLRVRDTRGKTWVVMDASPSKEGVAAFVQISSLLSRAGTYVPAVEASDLDAGFLLLTDLGDDLYLTLLDTNSADSLYAEALRALVRMQQCVPVQELPVYTSALLHQEMMLFPDWFFREHLGYLPSDSDEQVLMDAFALLGDSAREQPYAFVHRDYHCRNLLRCREGLGVLDFQDAVNGPLTYDLVSLLRDVYVEWPPPRVEMWAERYRQMARTSGLLVDDDRQKFQRWFDLMGLQRHLKVAGIFARLCYRDGKTAYLASLPLTLRYLMDVAARYPELSSLAALIENVLARFDASDLVRARDRRS